MFGGAVGGRLGKGRFVRDDSGGGEVVLLTKIAVVN